MPLDEIMRRIVLEPRAAYIKSTDCWLVAYDKDLQQYICEGRAYKRFKNSDEAYEWIQRNY